MKTPADVTIEATRRLERTWHQHAAGISSDWPHTFALGRPSRAELEAGFAAIQAQALEWRAWAATHHVTLMEVDRSVLGTSQPLPTGATLDAGTAARIASGDWPAALERGQARAATITSRYPHLTPAQTAAAVRAMRTWTDIDFEMAQAAADWFAAHDATGLTPRQVPIDGFHAKWLNTRQPIVALLAGRDDLGLRSRHPGRVHLTYLDPDHLAAGGRRHDCATVGDTMRPAYAPRVILISENKDTAVLFPDVPGGIAIEGEGKGAGACAALDWITSCPHIVYWGDIDEDGYAILDQFRSAGIAAVSILMDPATQDTYRRYEATTDAAGKPLTVPARRTLTTLTDAERTCYQRITDPHWNGPRRIEQERIGLETARAALDAVIAEPEATSAPSQPTAEGG